MRDNNPIKSNNNEFANKKFIVLNRRIPTGVYLVGAVVRPEVRDAYFTGRRIR